MGSFRRPRPRFMSSPVLSDLARFHASSPSLQVSNSSVWNRINKAEKIVQSAVIKVFQGGALQTNELFTLNESISLEYQQLERLVEVVVSPYVRNVLHNSKHLLLESRHLRLSGSLPGDQPEITVTQHHGSSSLAPLVEQEGEAYLEKAGGVRRHTVANAHSDVRLLLSASGRMHAEGGGGRANVSQDLLQSTGC
ncbi:hypothetical protein F2P81_006667 [Scophthalmus maximus]|uniref:Uncharacterized protein n=1 Tax=Scophthalmus maximus TaxID=52904 RepID=A0A6A4T7E3_SCOMX|nr:hypothetical protein F2P81_006667 [Scophthalmus maximus]